MVDDITHEGLRIVLREEGVTFQCLKTWKASKDPRYAAKKARVEQLYAIADREVTPRAGDPEVVFCVDEFGPLNLQPRPGRHWAAIGGKGKEPGRAPRPRMPATYTRSEQGPSQSRYPSRGSSRVQASSRRSSSLLKQQLFRTRC